VDSLLREVTVVVEEVVILELIMLHQLLGALVHKELMEVTAISQDF
jgi:hypothetical protein